MSLRFDLLPPTIAEAHQHFEAWVSAAQDVNDINRLKGVFIGRKASHLTLLTDLLKQTPKESKADLGALINHLKMTWETALSLRLEQLVSASASSSVDLTLTPPVLPQGAVHPIQRLEVHIVSVFRTLGYHVEEGPEVETEEHNFDGLNIAPNHPARRSSDTFYFEAHPHLLLRTHTSPVQVRVLKRLSQKNSQGISLLESLGGIRFLSPGRVYRKDEIDPTHSPMFHQVEGMLIGKNIGLQHLKGTLSYAMKALLGADTEVRSRPGYFTFVEPGCEVDVKCPLCKGQGCRVCKSSGWIEILGAGLVHPHVLSHAGIDSTAWSGFAFGMGIERIAMIISECPDLRLFFENDLRFLQSMREVR